MKKEDVKDTVECRKAILSYVEYLEKGGERIPDDFITHVADKMFTKSSLVSLKKVLENVADKLSVDIDKNYKTKDQAQAAFNEARDKAFKHCIILELKHNISRKDEVDKIKKQIMDFPFDAVLKKRIKKQ